MRKLSRLAASLILSLALGLLAAQRTAAQSSGFVAGTVVEEGTQRPVAGAQVVAEGVGLGTITDARGRFRIEGLSPGRVTLRVQMLGYQNAAQAASVGSGEVRFALSQAAIELDQIVVTGTAGGSRQRAVGNAVARVDAARISEVAPVTSMSQLIGGREPGVNILPGSGNVGTGSVLKVRGNSSVSLRNQPLVYVDGIRVDNNPEKGPSIRQGRQVSALDDINPNDIERVEVIKGPAAATLYGTEASGGVIQIITKRGTSGAPSFDLQVRQGATWLMNVEDKLPDSYGTDPQTGELFSVNLLELERTAGREVFRTGHLQTYSLGMRGGNEQMRYYAAAEWDDNEGILDYNWQEGLSLRGNLTVAPSDRLTADISTGYVQGSTRFAQAYTGYDVWAQFVFGNPNGLNAPTRGYLRATPETLRDLESTRDNSRFTGSLTLRHNPVSWLNPRLVVGLDQSDETNAILFPRNPAGSNYFFGALSLGDKTVERPRVGYNTLDYGATASFQPAGDIGLKTSAGAQFYHKRTETTIATGRTFPTPAITTISGAAVRSSEEFFVENKSFGVYLQQEVAFRDRVFVTGAAAQEARPTTLAGRSTVYAPHAALATSQPLATAAGMEILSRGGNAFDAAVAAAAVLNVVEPHMTGIGGDMFALVWSAREKKLVAMNALGRAGSGMTREELLRRGHDRVPGKGAEAITVPGAVSGWAALLERYGKLSLAEVLQPAIRIAEEGFPVSPIIARQWRALEDDLREDPGAAATFLVDGKAPAAGQWFRNPDLARSFRAIAEQGPAAMYGGDLGRRLVEGVRERGGFLTPEDMARHRVEWVTPVSAPFRGYRLWEMPPPNQGVAALQMMRILDAYDLKAMGHNSPEYLHHLIEAKKLAYADLDGHVGDPDHMRVSVDDLVSEEYIRGRRALLSPDTAAERVDPGRARTETETVYLAAADAEGNMVSFINSVFGYFGSGVVVPGTGIVLQNRGAGFTLEEGHPNTVAPGKRPFHTLVPAFVTRTTPRGEEPWLAFGVMGGSMQPQGHAQVLLNLLVFDMDLQEAIDAARFRHLSGKRVVLEAPVGDEVRARLRAMGHEVLEQPSDYGGAQAVMRLSRGWAAASDPRKDGHAAGR